MWPIVVPPVYAKQELRPTILNQVWADARESIEQADWIVFFGYSLPELDVEAEKLFERGLAKNRALHCLDVVNPAPPAAARFASTSPSKSVRWHPSLSRFFGSPDVSVGEVRS